MDSSLLLALSLPVTTLLLGLFLWLILAMFLRGQQQYQQQQNLTLAAALKTSLSSMTDTAETLKTISEDNRSATVALLTAARESTTLQMQAQQSLMTAGHQQLQSMAVQQNRQHEATERSITRQHESLTSLLTTTIRLLGTKDPISYTQVANAERTPDGGTEPYATGDDLEVQRRQQLVDELFSGYTPVGDTDAGFRSDLGDFGLDQN
jgi:hypothetical protein